MECKSVCWELTCGRPPGNLYQERVKGTWDGVLMSQQGQGGGGGKMGTLIHYWWECGMGEPLWNTV